MRIEGPEAMDVHISLSEDGRGELPRLFGVYYLRSSWYEQAMELQGNRIGLGICNNLRDNGCHRGIHCPTL